MTKKWMGTLKIGVGASLLALVMANAVVAQQYEVTVTNITAHQVFTPLLVASHTPGLRLFELGQPASAELEMLAEGGDIAPLMTAAMGSADVMDVQTNGAVMLPGESVTVVVTADSTFNQISVAAMLIPTNDAFMAVNSTTIPDGPEAKTIRALGYDSGTEANDQLCNHIPGPPSVCTGEGFNVSRDEAEGFVHIHRGIHAIGDLAPETYDWRNPVANVTIRAMATP